MTGLAGQLQNGAGTARMLHSASGGTGEHLLLASVLLTTAVFLAACIADMHDWLCRVTLWLVLVRNKQQA